MTAATRRTFRRAQAAFTFLARRRAAGVGLALLVEVAILGTLSLADAGDVVGLPGATTAAIAGTVAVVFGPWDGALVALVGALVFGTGNGWGGSEVVTIVFWPAIVLAAGIFARRVSYHRVALQHFVTAQELERERLALQLHDETAQTLAAALFVLKGAQGAEPAQAATANASVRELLQESIERVRALAVELRPRSLDDLGLGAAVERLGATYGDETGVLVDVDACECRSRLPRDVELALYRVVQAALASAAARRQARRISIVLERTGDIATLLVEDDGHPTAEANGSGDFAGLKARLAVVGGDLSVRPREGGGTTVRAEVEL